MFDHCFARLLLPLLAAVIGVGNGAAANVRLDLEQAGKPISRDLVGVFFEDINYAADGGLYAELVQNRSFEYDPVEQRGWQPLSFWELVKRGGGEGSVTIDRGRPVHQRNPHYAVIDVSKVGDGVGVSNPGFDGIAVRAGEPYNFSAFVRQLYVEQRWGGREIAEGERFKLTVQLEEENGKSLGAATIEYGGGPWQRVEATVVPERTAAKARLVLLSHTQGGVACDMVSLFPQHTFRNRPNGLRKDLAEAIAALHPKFVRFPGGCLVHGNGLGNLYRWPETVGPVEERRGQSNLWGYHQTMGLGYFEYFQFCEDIGAKPLPVVPAAVCCQNSGLTAGMGQEGLPLEEMDAYIQEVLDLVEWATGPADSKWGALRAAAGHPAPFKLEYLGVGNEERITPVFEQRFRLIHAALAKTHPEITVVGTTGPWSEGPDYEAGWKIAHALQLPMVDEHYYQPPEWFLKNLSRYDAFDRDRTGVYVGEYAAHDADRRSTLRSALAEAAYLTHLERNADVVRLASYAPLLAKQGHTQWRPDLIYFDNTQVSPTVNYFVQQLFGVHCGDRYLTSKAELPKEIACSAVRDSGSGDVILKFVNTSAEPHEVQLDIAGLATTSCTARQIVLTGDPLATNEFGSPPKLTPTSNSITLGAESRVTLSAHSLTVIRLPR